MTAKIVYSIKYIGVNDLDIDLFENQYKVPNGISYNSYLIEDEKITVMDTTDETKTVEWNENLTEALNGREVDYLVISHLEPDHSSGIKSVTEKYPNVTLVGTSKTFEMLPQFYDINPATKKLVVKEGDTLNIGKHTLQFFMAPMVHWPEVMITYEQTEKVLFSADAFGTFDCINGTKEMKENTETLKTTQTLECTSKKSKEVNTWTEEARRYYINIAGKYGMQVQMLLKKLANLEVKVICPLHGPVLNKNVETYINKYNIWSNYEPENKGILIAFATIHGNTGKVAYKMAELLKACGEKNVVIMDLSRDDISRATSNAFRFDKMILAAASYNMGVFPCMETFLNALKGRNYQNRKVGMIENGSWAPSAGKCMKDILLSMKGISIVDPMITIKSAMKETDIPKMKELVNSMLN